MPPIGSDSHGDGDTIPEDLEEDYFPPDFKEYLLQEQLKWSSHEEDVFWDSGWVFWSQQDHEIEPPHSLDNCADFNRNVCPIPKVRDNIRLALQKLMPSFDCNAWLVQFWAATTTLEGRTKLTTQYQPFALGPAYDAERQQLLCEYRMKMCRDYNFFYADAESGEEQQLGLPGRVFLHKSPESSPRVKYYSTKEYPQRDLALGCEIKLSWAVPVFEHSSQTCVGVLEMVSLDKMWSNWRSKSFPRNIRDSFQEFGLIYLDGYCEMQCRDDNIIARTIAFQELNMVLRSVCKIHELPLAMTWVPWSASNDLLCGQLMSKVLDYVKEEDSDEEEDSDVKGFIDQFLEVSKFTPLKKGGVSERVLSFPYMLYCSDITQFSIAEYPWVLHARRCNFNGWFTICLQSSLTEKEICVVDFFLPESSEDDENILTMLSSILETMGEKFKTFKLASGKQLGKILSVEVMDFRSGKKLPFVQMIQAPRLSPSPELLQDRGLTLQLGQLDQPSTDSIHSGMNVVSEEQNYILPCLEALQNGEVTMQLDSPRQLPLDPSNNGHNVFIIEENIIVVAGLEEGKRKTQEREHKKARVRIEISLEDILKCSQMSQKNAARKLKVSGYALKRVCREYGIPRWPPRKRNMGCSSRPLPVENQNQNPEMNPDTCSDQASAHVANINLGFEDADMMTIKAKYAEYSVKFRLSSSPRLVQLRREVEKRLKLEAETYYVQYEDEENELILIACDEDLQACVRTSISSGRTSTVVLLKPKQPITM